VIGGTGALACAAVFIFAKATENRAQGPTLTAIHEIAITRNDEPSWRMAAKLRTRLQAVG